MRCCAANALGDVREIKLCSCLTMDLTELHGLTYLNIKPPWVVPSHLGYLIPSAHASLCHAQHALYSKTCMPEPQPIRQQDEAYYIVSLVGQVGMYTIYTQDRVDLQYPL